MVRVIRETEEDKHIVLYETEKTRIKFVECKEDRDYDRLYFIKMGNEYYDPERIVIYRWEDEEFINDVLKRYGAE